MDCTKHINYTDTTLVLSVVFHSAACIHCTGSHMSSTPLGVYSPWLVPELLGGVTVALLSTTQVMPSWFSEKPWGQAQV